MNLAFIIIGVPAVGVATFYAAMLWGRWPATFMAVGLTLILVTVGVVDSRRRRAGREESPAQR